MMGTYSHSLLHDGKHYMIMNILKILIMVPDESLLPTIQCRRLTSARTMLYLWYLFYFSLNAINKVIVIYFSIYFSLVTLILYLLLLLARHEHFISLASSS